MGIQDRRSRERAAVRSRALDAARHIAETQGCDAVTIRKIAEAIEYAPSALYAMFEDKAELLQHVAVAGMRDVIAVLESLPLRKDPVDRLTDLAMAQIEYALAAPDLYRLMFAVVRGPHTREPVREVAVLRARKRELVMTGPSGPDAGPDSWDLFEASVHGLSMLAIDGLLDGGAPRARRLARKLAERHAGCPTLATQVPTGT
jgi:AcrR family transcriptional regulator